MVSSEKSSKEILNATIDLYWLTNLEYTLNVLKLHRNMIRKKAQIDSLLKSIKDQRYMYISSQVILSFPSILAVWKPLFYAFIAKKTCNLFIYL